MFQIKSCVLFGYLRVAVALSITCFVSVSYSRAADCSEPSAEKITREAVQNILDEATLVFFGQLMRIEYFGSYPGSDFSEMYLTYQITHLFKGDITKRPTNLVKLAYSTWCDNCKALKRPKVINVPDWDPRRRVEIVIAFAAISDTRPAGRRNLRKVDGRLHSCGGVPLDVPANTSEGREKLEIVTRNLLRSQLQRQ